MVVTSVAIPKALATPTLGRHTFGMRHLQVFLLFCFGSVSYATRVNLSVGIVAMMDRNDSNPNFPEYKWTEQEKSYILSSMFWGYIFTQVPSGSCSRRYGGKVILLISVAVNSLLAILTPLSVRIGNWQLLCVVRFLQGAAQGVSLPAYHTVLAKWAPVEERASLGSYCFSGGQFGTVIMLATSGLLAASRLGWPSIFYIPGTVGLLWSLAWIFLGANSPAECKSISSDERNYIESSLRQCVAGVEHVAPKRIPWLQILTSPPFLALLLSNCGYSWGFWTLLTQIPSYMKSVLGKDIKSNALLSALPNVAMLVMGFAFCPIANAIERRKCMSTTTSRKFFNTIGQWIPAVTLIGMGYVTRDQSDLAVVLLTFTVGIIAAGHLGFEVNHIDLSPNFAGVLVGVANTVGSVMSIIAPLLVGYIVTDTSNTAQWRIIFFIAAGYKFIGNLVFIIFGEAKVQPWDNVPSNETSSDIKVLAEKTKVASDDARKLSMEHKHEREREVV